MDKKKLAIVTSYGDLCGNAEYSDVLKKGLNKIFDVSIIPLNMDIMRAMTRKAADKYIINIANQLTAFDYVNIQFESGLFGILPRDILKRFCYLFDASNKLVVTMHRVDVKLPLFSITALNCILRLKMKKFLTESMNTWRNNQFAKVYVKVSKLCAKHKTPIIVHSTREKHRILSISNFKATAADHPLTYLTLEEAEYYKKLVDKPKFLSQHNLPKNAITIGTFGFIAPYKGIPVLMKCLPFLPENYHVLVFGSQHPLKVNYEPNGDSHIIHYMNLLTPPHARPVPSHTQKKRKLRAMVNYWAGTNNVMAGRFHFLGGFHEHEDFIKAMASCDVVVFPYNEVGQSASGVLGLALDLQCNIICSQTLAFLELLKYAGSSVRIFSIGNHLELAEKIRIAVKNGVPSREILQQYNQKYNLDSNARFYADLLESL